MLILMTSAIVLDGWQTLRGILATYLFKHLSSFEGYARMLMITILPQCTVEWP